MLHQTIQITESQRKKKKTLRPAVHARSLSLSHTHKHTHTHTALSGRLSVYTLGGSSVTSAKGISTTFPSGGCGQMD